MIIRKYRDRALGRGMNARSVVVIVLMVIVVLVVGAATVLLVSPSAAPPIIGGGQIQHVLLIVFEDEPYPGGSTFQRDAPYLTGLISTYAFAGNYQSISFPSLGGYMALTGGTQCYPPESQDGGVGHCLNLDPYPENDASPNDTRLPPGLQEEDVQPSGVKSIGYLFDQKGLTWRAFEEDMPYPCYAFDYHSNTPTPGAEYSVNHNPFVYYQTVYGNGSYPTTDPYPATVNGDGGDSYCRQHVLPFTSTPTWNGETLTSDLANGSVNMPNFAFIIPDEVHGGGDYGNLSSIDGWARSFLTPILSDSSFVAHAVIFMTFDDTGSPCCGELYTIAIGPPSVVKQGYTSSILYNHYSLLATIEDIFGLGNLGRNDASATPMSDLFISTHASQTPVDRQVGVAVAESPTRTDHRPW